MDKAFLLLLANRQRQIGELPQPKATQAEIERLFKSSKQILSREPDPEYGEMLAVLNGIDFNGMLIFAAQAVALASVVGASLEGFVEANERRRTVPGNDQYLIYGESGMDMFVQPAVQGLFQVVDRSSLTVFETFSSFGSMLESICRGHL